MLKTKLTLIPLLLCLLPARADLHAADDGSEPLSRRVVAYTITARLDTETWTLDCSETVSFRNSTRSATSELVFHLYANAIANSGTVNQKGRRSAADFAALDRTALGYMDVKSVALADGSALPAAPAIDGTIMRVPLAEPLEPGEEIALSIEFSAKLPHRSLSRSGFIGHHFQASQWYPKLAVLEESGWVAPQFLRHAEFYGPFGTFDVVVTLPADYNVEGTGQLSDVTIDEAGELKTVTFRAEDVHDFAWVADANALMPTPSTYEGVKIVNVVQPYAEAKTDQINRVLKECLSLYADWYMPYPYERLVVAGAPHRITSGMEYPGFINISFRFPLHLDWLAHNTFDPAGVTVHEFTHQYFYGIVANNEARDPWLDEGLTTYSSARAMDAIYGPGVSITFLARLEKMMLLQVLNRGFGLYGPDREGTISFWKRALNVTSVMGYGRSPFHGEETSTLLGYPIEDLNIDGFNTRRSIWMKEEYAPLADTTVVTAPVGEFYPESYHPIAYSKAALALETIENHIGRDAMKDILKTYVEEYRFAHPRGEDFLAILADKAGPQYSGMVDQLFQGTGTVDFAVDYVVCREIEEPVGFATQTAPGDAVVYSSGAGEEEETAPADPAGPSPSASEPAGGTPPEPGEDAGQEAAEAAAEPQEGAPEPPAGGEEEPADPGGPIPGPNAAPGYEWEAIIRNRGTVALPVEVELLFEGGRTERRVFNGWEPFMHLSGRSPERLLCATVDPDHKFSLDLNRINNSRTVRYQKEGVLFLSGVAHFWTQNILNGWAFFN